MAWHINCQNGPSINRLYRRHAHNPLEVVPRNIAFPIIGTNAKICTFAGVNMCSCSKAKAMFHLPFYGAGHTKQQHHKKDAHSAQYSFIKQLHSHYAARIALLFHAQAIPYRIVTIKSCFIYCASYITTFSKSTLNSSKKALWISCTW